MANTGHVAIEVQNVIAISDEKTKSNIAPLGGNSLDIIKQLKPVTYRFNSGDNKTHAGFIAQDVEKVLPNLIHKNDSLDVKGVAYLELIPYLVEAIQEQQKIIESLQARLSASNVEFDTDATYANFATILPLINSVERQNPLHTSGNQSLVNNTDGIIQEQ